MVNFLLYLVYKIFKAIVLILPHSFAKIFLDGLSYFVYIVDTKHKYYAKANLNLVYQNSLNEKRKNQIIKNSYKNMIYNIYEFIQNPTLSLLELEKKVTVLDEHILTDAIKNNRKIILISAHYGNWEYITSYISLKYKPTTMVGRKMNNKYLNEDLIKNRTKHNSEMLDKNGSAMGLMKALKNGRIVGLAIDQNNPKGIEVEFMGHRALMVDSVSRLAVKTDAIIIPVFFDNISFGKYNINFLPPIEPSGFDDIKKLTQKQADILGDYIYNHPDQWFWQHKRFKIFYKDIYER
ncbi:MAG: hypothetical protein B1H07_03915 [Campylobacteraceae bacterium 4484_166]|nr:MAG: hypothetical protein B1H07_03915 [Campylobacteraceae bacterium 4484_166]